MDVGSQILIRLAGPHHGHTLLGLPDSLDDLIGEALVIREDEPRPLRNRDGRILQILQIILRPTRFVQAQRVGMRRSLLRLVRILPVMNLLERIRRHVEKPTGSARVPIGPRHLASGRPDVTQGFQCVSMSIRRQILFRTVQRREIVTGTVILIDETTERPTRPHLEEDRVLVGQEESQGVTEEHRLPALFDPVLGIRGLLIGEGFSGHPRDHELAWR